MTKLRKSRLGFTLIEVLLVVGILLAMGAIGAVVYSKIKASSDHDMTLAKINDSAHAIDIFYNKMGRYPTTEKGFNELIAVPEDEKEAEVWKTFCPLLKAVPQDQWRHDLNYELIEGSAGAAGTDAAPQVHIWSNGPDGVKDTADDIKNWKDEK